MAKSTSNGSVKAERQPTGPKGDVIKALPELEVWELTFVQLKAEGHSSIKAGVLTERQYPALELNLTAKNAQRLAAKPHIRDAIAQAQGIKEQTTTMTVNFQAERVRSVVPSITAAAILHLESGLEGIQEGIEEMRVIIAGEKTPLGLKIGALGQLTKTVELMVRMSGVMQSEKVLHGQERTTKEQGMSSEVYKEIMGNILADIDTAETETVEAGAVLTAQEATVKVEVSLVAQEGLEAVEEQF